MFRLLSPLRYGVFVQHRMFAIPVSMYTESIVTHIVRRSWVRFHKDVAKRRVCGAAFQFHTVGETYEVMYLVR